MEKEFSGVVCGAGNGVHKARLSASELVIKENYSTILLKSGAERLSYQ